MYENWLADREAEVLKYARSWARQYEGTELEMDGTLYLVRETEQTGDEAIPAPRNSVIINIPPEQDGVTPYDLLNEDGTLKKPE